MEGVDPIRVLVMIPGSRPVFSLQALQCWMDTSMYLLSLNRYKLQILSTETSVHDLRMLRSMDHFDILVICQPDILFKSQHWVMVLEAILFHPVVCGYTVKPGENHADCQFNGTPLKLMDLLLAPTFAYVNHTQWGFAALRRSVVDMITTPGDLSALLMHAEVPMVVHSGLRVYRETFTKPT